MTVVLSLFALVLLYFVNPADPEQSTNLPKCIFHSTTGFHCPGCGSSRAVHQLLHGRPDLALAYNPLATLLLPVVAYVFFAQVLEMISRFHLPRMTIKVQWLWTLLAVVVLFWILRNVPLYPFTLLAPGGWFS